MAEDKRRIVYNCHMHLLNFAITPDDYYDSFFYQLRWVLPILRQSTWLFSLLTKRLAGGTLGALLDRASSSLPSRVNEQLLKSMVARALAMAVSGIMKTCHFFGRKSAPLRHVSQLLRLYKSNMNRVADEYVKQMEKAGIDVATPLMIDLGFTQLSSRAEVPFEYQIALIQEQMIRHPGKFLPFMMYDPRRREGLEMVQYAVTQLGFGGVKMYPALGFHPWPESPVNDTPTCQSLCAFYDWAHDEQVPITVHCSQGGAVSDIVSMDDSLKVNLARPYNWGRVLKRWPYLVLNLAHIGGYYGIKTKGVEFDKDSAKHPSGHLWDERFVDLPSWSEKLETANKKCKKQEKIQRALRWRNDILCLMRKYHNVYTDVSSCDRAYKEPDPYFSQLKFLLSKEEQKMEILNAVDNKYYVKIKKYVDTEMAAIFENVKLCENTKLGRVPPTDQKILFGSDWPQLYYSWNEEEWTEPYRANLNAHMFKKLTHDNPTRFLKHSLKRLNIISAPWGCLKEESKKLIVDGL